ncbi:MAG: FAD-dependent oxidoreductase [Betaproteobacteria bacterium]
MTPKRLLLVGGGHAHIEVLRRFAAAPPPDVTTTLVSATPGTLYSGMLPGVIAGHYALADATIDLAPLAQAAGAQFVADPVVRLDLYIRIAHLASGTVAPFDVLSLDVGSAPDVTVPGAGAHAVGVKPFAEFLAAWEVLQIDAAAERVRTVAVVGGGAGGIEVLLAMQYRLVATLGPHPPRFVLVTELPHLLALHARAVRRTLGKVLVARDVVLELASPALAVEAGAIVTTGGRRIAADRIFMATTAVGAPWLAASGLECDDRGFVYVDDCLQSVALPFVFAAGDCASPLSHAQPKSGVNAVRHGPPLAANLLHAARGTPPEPFVPGRHALALISTGDRQAVASRGLLTAAGAWVWRWKDRIDRRFVARYRIAGGG